MLKAIKRHGPSKPIHFYCSSGGNAGLACATSAISLGRPATIVVPLTTKPLMISKLKMLKADVHQHGASWMEADGYLRTELLGKDKNGVYVPPFDHEDIWDGAASMIDEMSQQLGVNGFDAVACSVGGGGLLCGVMEGLSRREAGWANGAAKPVKVLAVETAGADSLSTSLKAGQLVTLPGITSIATSLGATRVAKKAFAHGQKENVTSVVVSDAEAAMACVRFADDERALIEVACGASVAPAYNGMLREKLGAGITEEQWKKQRVVIAVCGGNNVTLGILEEYREKYGKTLDALSVYGSGPH